jgi:hypothetical protein
MNHALLPEPPVEAVRGMRPSPVPDPSPPPSPGGPAVSYRREASAVCERPERAALRIEPWPSATTVASSGTPRCGFTRELAVAR